MIHAGRCRLKKTIWLFAACLALFPGSPSAEGGWADKSTVEINKGYVQERLVRKALEYLGTSYVSAGKSKKGVDCSGFVYAVYAEVTGRKLPLGTNELYRSLPAVKGALLPGDLVFFNTTGGVSHVGLVIGGSRIIHAASIGTPTGVKISSLEEPYYKTRYLGARRVFQYTAPVLYATLGGTRVGTELKASFEPGRPFSLAVAHKRKGSGVVSCRLLRIDGNEKTETKKIAVAPGREAHVAWTCESTGDWAISFTESAVGDACVEILRIEVKVERAYEPPGKPAGRSSSGKGPS
jgi:hypothetical protein